MAMVSLLKIEEKEKLNLLRLWEPRRKPACLGVAPVLIVCRTRIEINFFAGSVLRLY